MAENIDTQLGLSIYARNALLEHYIGRTAFTAPTIYIALVKADHTEISGGGYARIQTSASDWASASGGEIESSSTFTFQLAFANYGSVTHILLYDAATNGNLIASSTISPVYVGGWMQITAGNLVVSLSGNLVESECNAMLNHVFGKASLTQRSSLWLSMADASNNEPSSAEFARKEIVTADWDVADNGTTETLNDIAFPHPVSTWGSMSKTLLFDAETSGNMLGSKSLPSTFLVNEASPTPTYQAGNVRIVIV